jgi:hypothetical protein
MPRAINSLSSRNKFAKRHYEAIALAMQECRMHIRCDGIEQMECVVKYLADLFAADNGQFKRDRFMHACEPGANVRARTNGGHANV